MATTVDTLLVRIEADLSGLRKDLNKVQNNTKQASDKMQKSLGGINKSTERLSGAFKRLALAAGAFFGAGAIIRSIRTFEDLQATLKAVTGSAELAQASFKLITKFTAQTTFQLEEVTGAFITLVNAGIAPTEDALKDIGNIAAARGKSIEDVAQAIFNATTGEMDMLKSLGIVARVEGEKLAVTYKGVTTEIDRSGDSIVNYIRELSQQNFPNAIAERAKTLTGAISNLGDAMSLFFMEIGNAGLREALTDLAIFLSGGVQSSNNLAKAIGKTLGGAIRGLTAVLRIANENMGLLIGLTAAYASAVTITMIANVAKAFIALGSAIRNAGTMMEMLNKGMKRTPIFIALAGLVVLADQMNLLDGALDSAFAAFDRAFGDPMTSASDNAEALTQSIEQLGVESQNSAKKLTPLEEELQNTNDAIADAILNLQGYSNAQRAAMRASGELEGLSFLGGDDPMASMGREVPTKRPLIDPELAKRIAVLEELNQRIERNAELTDFANKTLEMGVTPTQQYIQGLNMLDEALSKGIIDTAEFTDAQDNLTKAFNESMPEVQNAQAFVSSLATEEENLIKLQDDLNTALHLGMISQTEYNEAMEETEAQMKALDPLFATMLSGLESVSRSVSDQFADMLMSGKLNLESLQSVFSNFVKVMISKAIELAVINNIINSLFGLKGSNALPTIPIGGSAGGGAISGPTIVGERGPELFIPSSTGTIKNNMDTNNILGGSGGSVVNQTINIETGVSQTVRAEIMTMMPMIKQTTMQAVTDSKRRGGQIASAFGT